MDKRSRVLIYTDASCDGNPGPGGFAAIIMEGGFRKEIAGKIPHSTINRMELIDVIKGLHVVKPNSKVMVYTDSAYVEQAVNEGRLALWQQNGWRRIRTGTEVLCKNDWLVLLEVIRIKRLNVQFRKIAAHKGHKINERVDFLARQAAKSA